jgi:hypothetical protein
MVAVKPTAAKKKSQAPKAQLLKPGTEQTKPALKPCLDDWKNSAARAMLEKDLLEGVISRDFSDKPSQLWEERYKGLVEFKDVPYRQFSTNLRALRNQLKEAQKRSDPDEAALEHDLKIHQPRSHNDRGEPKFADSEAQELLRKIVKMKKHVGVSPEDLYHKHELFKQFPKKKFKERIYQEERYQRFVNYLNDKRELKRQKNAAKKKKKSPKHDSEI